MQGDIVLLDFNPIRGHEQAGYRPGVVISNNVFNEQTGMVMVCPITSNLKVYPTHYILEDTKKFPALFYVNIFEASIMKREI